MCPALLTVPGTSGEPDDHRHGPLRQTTQRCFDLRYRLERRQSLGALAQLTSCLRPAQHEEGNERHLGGGHTELLVEQVRVAKDGAAVRGMDESGEPSLL